MFVLIKYKKCIIFYAPLAKSYPKFYLVLEIGEGINLNASTSYMLISLDFLICGFQHLFILFKLWILSTSMCNYLLMRVMGIIDVKFNPWNLYSRRRGHLCWNTVEELIEIDSTEIFIIYIHV